MLSNKSKNPRLFYSYIIVAVAFFIMVVAYGAYYSFGVFFKPVLAEFGWSRAVTSGAYSFSFLLYGFLGMFMGRLSDKFGPRIVLTVCGFFLGLGYLLMSQISTIWQLYLFFGVVIAIGISGIFVPLTATVTRWFVKRRGLMTGIAVSGIGTGTIIVPPTVRWLISIYGWQLSYIIVGIAILVLIIPVSQFLKRDPSRMEQLAPGENEIMLGTNLISEDNAFSFREVIHAKQFWMFCALFSCHSVGQQAMIVHVVPHATDLGFSAIAAANVLATIGGASIVGRLGTGNIRDKIGNKLSLIICLTLLSVALFGLMVAKELWMLYLLTVIFGFGYGGMVTLVAPTLAELFGLKVHGEILGAVIFAGNIGGALGPLMAGYMFDITNSYQSTFLICAVLSVISLILASKLTPTHRDNLTENGR